tara:strand:+ start:5780 stop:5899 length:120 start_codon:yes stop_codon:yes gene_type:complete
MVGSVESMILPYLLEINCIPPGQYSAFPITVEYVLKKDE